MDAIQWKLNVLFVVILAWGFCLWLLERKIARVLFLLAQLKKSVDVVSKRQYQTGPAFEDDFANRQPPGAEGN